MYKNGFVLAVKNPRGKVLREDNNKVFLPFYDEYSILIKNKQDKRAQAKIEIDGTEVSSQKFVIDAYGELDLKRFVLDGDLNKGKRFKFVPASDSRVQDPTSSDNGIIKVTLKREKERPYRMTPYYFHPDIYDGFDGEKYTSWMGNTITCGSSGAPRSTATLSTCSMSFSEGVSGDVKGATVGGSNSEQSFGQISMGDLEDDETVLRLRLVPVEKAVTTKDTKNKYCVQCGDKLPYNAKFCSGCGNRQP